MKRFKVCVIGCALILQCTASWAVYVVRISDLSYSPLPSNPIRVSGTVTSVSPVKISDGRAVITVTGRTATLGEFLVLDGSWNGQFFSVVPVVMIYIPAGPFLMGTPDSYTASHSSDEHPQHSAYLSAYSIGKYEVTRGEYRAFLTATGRAAPQYWAETQTWTTGQTFTQTENHPVVSVKYYEAEAYCAWAGGRLPTEAEWEKAARWDGHPRVYPWGDIYDVEKCNNYYDTNSAGGGYQRYQTAPVGSYPSGASPYGCQDMAGNVWEWVGDWYKSYPGSSSPFDYTNSYRVLRGGSWFYNVNDYRAACRSYLNPEFYWGDGGGFRLAR